MLKIFVFLFLVLQGGSNMTATYYADKFIGRKTASGSIFSQKKFTAASNKHPFGTVLMVTNIVNGKTVRVVVTDRLHSKFSHRIDLSKTAFAEIADLKQGKIEVTVNKP